MKGAMIGVDPPEGLGKATRKESTVEDRKDPKLEGLLAGFKRGSGREERPAAEEEGQPPREGGEGQEERPARTLPFVGRFARRKIV